MTEHAITCDAQTVRAILAGKTQMRDLVTERYWRGGSRVVKLQDQESFYDIHDGRIYLDAFKKGISCRLGVPGDPLWVKEASIIAPKFWNDGSGANCRDSEDIPRLVQYLATNPSLDGAKNYKLRVTPASRMPRWASRLTLEITEVTVEKEADKWYWVRSFKVVEGK